MVIAIRVSFWEKPTVKNAIPYTLISVGLTASLFAGEAVSTNTPCADSGFESQSWYGPPHLQFARNDSDTNLPGVPLAMISYSHTFSGDFDRLPGDVSMDRFSFWAPVAPLNYNDMHLFAFFNYTATRYDTSAPENALMLPEDTLNSLWLPLLFVHDVSSQWMWGAMVMPTYAGSSSSSDNFTISAALGAGYSYSPNLEIFAGAYYAHDYGDDFIIPGIAFTWRPAPRWKTYLMGPAAGVSYSVNDNLLVSLYGRYNSSTWYVKADGSGPDRNVSMSSMRVGLKAECQLHSKLWGYLAGGYAFAQELDVDDTDNDRIQKSDIDPSPFIECGLNLRF